MSERTDADDPAEPQDVVEVIEVVTGDVDSEGNTIVDMARPAGARRSLLPPSVLSG